MPLQPKIDITSVWHIAIATSAIEKNVERCWKDLGIGPWQFLTINSTERDTSVYGKQVSLDVTAAVTQVGFLTFGFDQPTTKPNPFEEILNKRGGGGAHHLALSVEDREYARKQMRSLGYREILAVDGIGPNGDGQATYFDTVEDMGTVIELSKLPSQMPEIDNVYPTGDEVKHTSNIRVRETVHAAIAVHDVEKTARHYEDVFGMGPAKIFTFEAPANCRGKEIKFAAKAALIQTGNFVLKLVQPLSKPNPLQDFLDKNGQGIHHFAFAVDDVRRSSEEMRRLGHAEVISVYNFGPNRDGDSAYFDTESTLGIVIELVKPPTGVSGWI